MDQSFLSSEDLTGKYLLALPGMSDPRFEKSLIYLCNHSSEGAMGIVINKEILDLSFDDLLDQLKIKRAEHVPQFPVHFGGPVEPGRGFVLHSPDYESSDATLKVSERVSMTATLDLLEDIAQGSGPDAFFFALGYAGWSPGQIEAEIVHNAWLVFDASEKIIFDRESKNKWNQAFDDLGIDKRLLSKKTGRA